MEPTVTFALALLLFFAGGFGGFYAAMSRFRRELSESLKDISDKLNKMHTECVRRYEHCPGNERKGDNEP